MLILILILITNNNRIARCDAIQGIRFETKNVGLIPPGNINERSIVNIEQ